MQPQSTDRVSGSTNPYEANILKRGSFTITPTSQASGFAGIATIPLKDISGSVTHPIIDVAQDISGGGAVTYRKCPFVTINTAGNVSSATSYYTTATTTPGGNQVDLVFSYFHLTSATATTFYYIVYSTAAAPPNSGGLWY